MQTSKHSYDYGLGIEPLIIDYIKESHIVQSRISSTLCYLLQRKEQGALVGSVDVPLIVTSYASTSPNYRTVIWNGEGDHPDLRLKTDEGQATIKVLIDGVEANRIPTIDDLEEDNEYCIVQRKDLSPARIEIVFNEGFNASAHEIQYYFYSIQSGISDVRVKEGEDSSYSLYGWEQHLDTSYDDYKGKHQILVRLPLTVRDLTISAEGNVILEERNSWTIWEPLIKDFDILIVPSQYSFTGKEERYEVIDKQNSVIQGQLISQRFKLKHIEYSDKRYQLSYVIE